MAEFKKVFILVTQEIVSHGIEFSQFVVWLESRKPGGGQLENWSEKEIQEEIKIFMNRGDSKGLTNVELDQDKVKSAEPIDDEHFNFDVEDMPKAGFGDVGEISRFEVTQIHDIEANDICNRPYNKIKIEKVRIKLERYVSS
jgi:hypothetical protein